jgi:hypothetical protein
VVELVEKLKVRYAAGQVVIFCEEVGLSVFLHVRMVWKLRDYAQESGMAGIDGRKSKANILKGVRRTRQGGRIEDKIAGVEDSMVEFLMTKGCRQVVLDRIVDGRFNREGCEENEEQCMGCRGGLVEDMDVVESVETQSSVGGGGNRVYRFRGTKSSELEAGMDVGVEEGQREQGEQESESASLGIISVGIRLELDLERRKRAYLATLATEGEEEESWRQSLVEGRIEK